MDHEEIIARLRRAKSIINSISVAGKQNWQALLLVTEDLDAVDRAVAAEAEAKEKEEEAPLEEE